MISKNKQEKGQGLVEYAIILALVAIVAIVVMGILGQHVSWQFYDIICMKQGGWDPIAKACIP